MTNGSLEREINDLKSKILDLVIEEDNLKEERRKMTSSYNAKIKVVENHKAKLVRKLKKLEVDSVSEQGTVLLAAATSPVVDEEKEFEDSQAALNVVEADNKLDKF